MVILAPGTAGVGDPVGDPQTEKVAWRVCLLCAGPVQAWPSRLVDRDDPATQSAMHDTLTYSGNNKNNSEQQSR